ncbi:MAG: primosomal protein N', partial [Clostridia bacterium]|nr:primosomal protein N' [Clostridia bacterium]
VPDSEFQNLKAITDVINDISYFDSVGAELVKFMRHRYFCSYISAVRCLLPPGVNMKFTNYYSLAKDVTYETIKEFCAKSVVADKNISCLNAYGPMTEDALKAETGKNSIKTTLRLLQQNGYIIVDSRGNDSISDTKKTFVELAIDRTEAFSVIDSIARKAPARARVLEILCDNYDMELSELLVCAETSKSTVDALHKKGLIAYHTVICNNSDITYDASYAKQKPMMSLLQQSAVDKISQGINSSQKSCYLMHGVTGSGKTEVYLSVLEEAIKKGKDAILLVPEISLTPQMISQIFGRFGDNVAVLHSRLTAKQRYTEWFKIKNGDVKIAVGARSAVFAPFKNLGLIIVDEEHESTYKAEMSPRYSAIEIARYRIDRTSGTLVLASATPLIDDYYKATIGTYHLIELPERINNSALPEVQIVDMRSELQDGNISIFSNALKDAITKCLAKKEQIILFLNRRGFSGFVSCRNCGYVMKCPRCNVALTYHKSVNKMVCHYCDYKTSLHDKCPSCGNKHIRFFGIGTEKIVEELTALYPHAKILRMDADTTSGRMAHENVLNHFRNGDADILVGTQMITKGLDFDNVTLVGIVAADMSLNLDDYRACERTFDLITQVVGRCGRASKKGKAIVQTYNPDDDTIVLSSMQDYK